MLNANSEMADYFQNTLIIRQGLRQFSRFFQLTALKQGLYAVFFRIMGSVLILGAVSQIAGIA